MIKKILLLISGIMLFLIAPNIIAQECNPSANIYLNFEAFSELYDSPSKYRFPFEMREHDWIFLTHIKIINSGDCPLPPSVIKLNIKPARGYIPKEKHPDNYGDYNIRIPELNVSDKYEIVFKEQGKSDIKLNTNLISNKSWWHWPILLDELGDWIIIPSLELEQYPYGNISGYGHTTYINGDDDIRRFRVYSISDLEDRENSKLSLKIAIFVMLITLITLIIDIGFKMRGNKDEKKKMFILEKILSKIKGKKVRFFFLKPH